MPPRARHLSEADQAMWAAYAQQIAPLRGRVGKKPASLKPPPARPTPAAPAQQPPPTEVAQPSKVRFAAAPLAVGIQPGGIDKATWQKFRSGRLATARTLDLHGMTAQRAFHALVSFLRTAHAEQVRYVEVVTGRGSGETGGVIRREFPHWLNLPEIRPLILGATHPHALNQGSVRLILRRIR
jgi:DNA-nicking Smr family endonuclease